MATIKKYFTDDEKPRYRVMWRDGKKQKSKSFDRFTAANDFKISIEHALREGSYVAPNKETVRHFLDDWFAVHKKGLAIKTIEGYELNIRHINKHIGDIPLQRLKPYDIEKMVKSLLETLSAKSVTYILMVLNLALKSAVKNRVINANPCDVVDRPKKKKYTPSIITPDRFQEYMDLFSDAWIYPGVLLSVFCGLRRGEILALQWHEIEYKDNKIVIKKSAGRKEKVFYEKPTKTERIRTVYLPTGFGDMLKACRKKQLENRALLGEEYIRYYADEEQKREISYVLVESNGKRPDPSYVSRFFNRRIKSSGLPHIRFQDLRQTAISLMLMAGAPIKSVSELAGHSTIKTTADIYAQVVEDSKRQAAETMSKYIKKQ
jgi:integrase